MNLNDNIKKFIDLLDNSENIIKITFSENTLDLLGTTHNIKPNATNFITSIDIHDENKINKLTKYINSLTHKHNKNDIIRENYYSQIRETNKNNIQKIYVEELNLLDIIQDAKTIYITQSNKIKQDKYSFPNLHKYHFEKNISIDEYIFDGFKLIIENNIIYIEINKKIYEKDILNQIINIILDF